MKPEDILDAIGEVDDEALKRAKEPISKKKISTKIFSSVAACFVIVLIFIIAGNNIIKDKTTSDSHAQGNSAVDSGTKGNDITSEGSSECVVPETNKSSNNGSAYYKINHTGIIEIKGTSQMSENVKSTVIPKEKHEELLNKIEALCLIPSHNESNTKGWEYSFSIKYENGEILILSFSKKEIVIDGFKYKSESYKTDIFSDYFN